MSATSPDQSFDSGHHHFLPLLTAIITTAVTLAITLFFTGLPS